MQAEEQPQPLRTLWRLCLRFAQSSKVLPKAQHHPGMRSAARRSAARRGRCGAARRDADLFAQFPWSCGSLSGCHRPVLRATHPGSRHHPLRHRERSCLPAAHHRSGKMTPCFLRGVDPQQQLSTSALLSCFPLARAARIPDLLLARARAS